MNALAVSGAWGTAVSDLIPATIVALLAVAGVVALGVAHRRGRTRVLARTVEFSDRVSVLPAWAAIPFRRRLADGPPSISRWRPSRTWKRWS